ncbi:MAG: NAD-dependent epimerase/dehydratase family protein [Bacteroidia bacterium]|jgi:dTDP-glucose 4,6-dehydratase/UDP-glucose 4-epimerase
MKLLIIGSEGFIGKHCNQYFQSQQHEVFGADVVAIERENYTCIAGNPDGFRLLFQLQNYDVCINASGSAHVGFSFEKPEVDFELNVLNVHKILVAIREFNPECKFINFSSAAVYGNPEKLPILEDAIRNPVSPYGFHKLQSESLMTEYHRFFGLQTCNLRVFSAYGPGLKKQLFWDLRSKSITNNKVTLFGTGGETRDFIYINDLVVAIACIINGAKFQGECYNIASGHEVSILNAVKTFFHLLDPEIQYNFNGERKQGDPDNWLADISKLKHLGFSPQFSLESGLQETVSWMKSIP